MIRVLQHGLEGMRTYATDADFAGGRMPDLDKVRRWVWLGFESIEPPTAKAEHDGHFVNYLFRKELKGGGDPATFDFLQEMRTLWVVDYDASTVTRVVFRP